MQASAASNRVIGRHQLTVVLVEGWKGYRSDISKKDVARIVREADEYWSRISGGKIRLSLSRVITWKRRPTVMCDVRVAQAIGSRLRFKTNVRQHLVALQPDTYNCGGVAGMAILGGHHIWLGQPLFSDPEAIVSYVGSTLTHEFGHILGLGHTSSPACSTAPMSVCTRAKDFRTGASEYGGTDIMGSGGDFLNPVGLRALGLLSAKQIRQVNLSRARDATISLSPLASRKGVRAVRVRWKSTEMWLSYDPRENGTPSIQVHLPRSRVLFQLPVDKVGVAKSPGLLPGGTYRLPRGQLTVVSLAERATLRFTFAPSPKLKVAPGDESVSVTWDPTRVPRDSGLSVRVFAPRTIETSSGSLDEEDTDPVESTAVRTKYTTELEIIDLSVQASAGTVTVAGLRPSVPYRLALLHQGRSIGVSKPFQVTPNKARLPVWTFNEDGRSLTAYFVPASPAFPVDYAEVYMCRIKKVSGKKVFSYTRMSVQPETETDIYERSAGLAITARVYYLDGTIVDQPIVQQKSVGACPGQFVS